MSPTGSSQSVLQQLPNTGNSAGVHQKHTPRARVIGHRPQRATTAVYDVGKFNGGMMGPRSSSDRLNVHAVQSETTTVSNKADEANAAGVKGTP